ncbi:MAG: hypothetical protein J1G07_02270 [Clostridiales bacterium]|nr:hypothetical protein [Clostridiales bacterium]
MRNKYVAVLDIRSTEMTAVVGERGVNKTFIIKSKYTCTYDGYAEGELLDIPSFTAAITDVVKSTLSAMNGIKTFYVSIPGEFLKLVNTDRVLSFPSAKKITLTDCRNLVDAAKPPVEENWMTIRNSCLYYVLSDKRKVIYPVGAISDSLQGKFCFFKCRNSFVGCIMDAFKKFKDIQTIRLIPSNYAEAMYIVEPERRDECAVLFDFGFISSTYSVICGNGILYSESFSLGIGHIAVYLMEQLDIPYQVAMTFLSTVNLNAKEKLGDNAECIYEGKTYTFPTVELRDRIREALDGICETIEECRQSYTGRNIEGKPILVTGEGIKVVRGAIEHIAGRLVKTLETVAPNVPYYDKPRFSSLFSLLDTALNDASAD